MIGKLLCKLGIHKNEGYWNVLPIAEKVERCKRCGIITLQTDGEIDYLTPEDLEKMNEQD